MAIVADLSGNSPIGLGVDQAFGQKYELPVIRPDAPTEVVAFGVAAANTLTFNNLYLQVRICSPAQDCFYKVGPGAVAAATDIPLKAGVIEYVKVQPGDRISVIQSTAGGNLHVTRGK